MEIPSEGWAAYNERWAFARTAEWWEKVEAEMARNGITLYRVLAPGVIIPVFEPPPRE